MISSLLVCFAVIATVLVTVTFDRRGGVVGAANRLESSVKSPGNAPFPAFCTLPEVAGAFFFSQSFHSKGGSGVMMIVLIVLLALIMVITVGVLLALGSVNWR